MSDSAPPPPEKRVAILVVHGVAAQQAGQSTDQVTDMLTSLRLDDGGYVRQRKSEFAVEQDEHDIPKLIDKGSPPPKDEHYDHLVMREALENYQQNPADHHFKTYCNVVRRDHRQTDADGHTRILDTTTLYIFECFWADLSRGGSYGYFRKFAEFYQFVLDLCSLGRSSLHGLEHSLRAHHARFPCRTLLKWLQCACEFLITGTIPVINILLLCLLAFSPILCQNADFQRWFFPMCGGFLIVCAMAFLIGPFSSLKREERARKNWFCIAIITGLLFSLFSYWSFNTPYWDKNRTALLATFWGWFAISCALGWWAIASIQRLRPYMAINFYILLPLGMLVLLWAIGHDYQNLLYRGPLAGKRALLHLAEVLMALGQLAWFSWFFLASVLVVACEVAMKRFKSVEPQADKCKNNISALQTLRISTSLAGLLILLVTLCTWQIAPILVRNVVKLAKLPVYTQSQHVAQNNKPSPEIIEKPGLLDELGQEFDAANNEINTYVYIFDQDCMGLLLYETTQADGFLQHSGDWSEKHLGKRLVEHLFPCTASTDPSAYDNPQVVDGLSRLLRACRYDQTYCIVLGLIAMLLVLVLAFYPVIQREANPPANLAEENPAPPEPGAPPKLLPWGLSLNEAFHTLQQVGWFVSWVIIFLATLSLGIIFVLGQKWEALDHPLRFPGFLVICGIVLLAAVAKIFGPMLAVTLDVINWLRDKPAGNTPRARIVARFLTMLRIVSWANELHHYEKFIILAHSQGTVIAAEALRALNRSETFKTAPPPGPLSEEQKREFRLYNLPEITLFTMGSPLLQLYAKRFPQLFGWVLDRAVEPDPTRPKPDPRKLYKLKQWVNIYGAMDYVGRTLWRMPKDDEPYISAPHAYWMGKDGKTPKAFEYCIGDTAHTHYWDSGSPVARHLHEMINAKDDAAGRAE
jgi:hypothetical protein